MNFVTTLVYHFCLILLTAFKKPGQSLLVIPCRVRIPRKELAHLAIYACRNSHKHPLHRLGAVVRILPALAELSCLARLPGFCLAENTSINNQILYLWTHAIVWSAKAQINDSTVNPSRKSACAGPNLSISYAGLNSVYCVLCLYVVILM